MLYIECPKVLADVIDSKHRVFLAGGITGCPDWQSLVVQKLKDLSNLTVFNPRRELFDFSIDCREQITWEFDCMQQSNVIFFYFPKESICPIALYELGRMLAFYRLKGDRHLVIGCDKEYERIRDLEIQVELASQGQLVVHSDLDETVDDLLGHLKSS